MKVIKMLAKYWKKIGIIILIVLCLVNGISKLTKVISFDETIDTIKSKITFLEKTEEKN